MKKVILFFLTPLLLNFTITISLAQTQLGSAITGEDNFGTSVTISGNGLRIAAISPGSTDTTTVPYIKHDGYIKILEWKNNEWDQIGQINKKHTSDFSGRQLALSKSGNHLVVGSPHFDSGNLENVGRVRVLSHDSNNGWTPVGTHLVGNDPFGNFGRSVDISDDGSMIAIIGQHVNDQGLLQIRKWDSQEWVLRGTNIWGEAYSVAMSNNGNRIAKGALYTLNGDSISVGSVKVYEWNNGDWVQMGDDLLGEIELALFGKVVDLSGDGTRLAVGSPNMYGHLTGSLDRKGLVKVFQWENGTWVQMGQTIRGNTNRDHFGFSVSMSEDGNRLVVGASEYDNNGEDKTGQVKVFEWADDQWIQLGTDTYGNSTENHYGQSVGISDDGNRIIASAPFFNTGGSDDGQVRVYDFSMLTATTSIGSFSLDIFPNPTKGKMLINGETLDRVKVIDQMGRLVLEINSPYPEIDLSMLSNGIYFLQCFKESNWVTRKVIKE